MKYIIIIIIIGISEIALIGELYDLLGLKVMFLTYVSTTIIGAFVLYLYSSKAKYALKASKKLGRNFKKRIMKHGHRLTQKEIEKLKPSIYINAYIAAVVLIVLPGILTDILGLVIVLPHISKWYINREINKYITKTETKNA